MPTVVNTFVVEISMSEGNCILKILTLHLFLSMYKGKGVKFNLGQATKAQWGSRYIALFFP